MVLARILSIPRLQSGGLNLGYRCTSRCRHCLYACGPHRRDGAPASPKALYEFLDEVKRRAPLASFHVGGGEPFVDLGLLSAVIEGFRTRGILLEYVETNASWARSEEVIAETLGWLRAIGLTGLLVSASIFHSEFIKPERTINLNRLARDALDGAVIVWIPEFLRELEGFPPDERIDIDALVDERGAGYGLASAMRYGVIPGGRGGRLLASLGYRMPWQDAARRISCMERLTNTTHFHVDFDGNYVPGLCGGIAIPFSLVPGEVPLSRFPLLELIINGGLAGLVRHAIAEHGFEPLEGGYSGGCDLCTHVRLHLHSRSRFPELGPEGFYDPRSIDGYGTAQEQSISRL